MNVERRYPERHAEFLRQCHAAGQTRPTPLLLQYVPGDFNGLHQDLYGDLAFPLQVAILLSEPDLDFTGGEFVITEQRPRMQSRAEVVPLRQGDAVAFAVYNRPVKGTKGNYRVNLRHGVSRLRSGQRHTVGIISMTRSRRAGPPAIEHLVLIAAADPAAAEQAFSDLRLTEIVVARFDMDVVEASCFLEFCGATAVSSPHHADAAFHEQLRRTLDRYELGGLFVDDGPGRHHHAVRPRGYDYSVDALDPKDMETWRSDYRNMHPTQQILAASIIWLYRGGKDHVWLRRVPCTWRATEALHVLRVNRALSDWGRLIFLFPGW
jgi:hypothetical protein